MAGARFDLDRNKVPGPAHQVETDAANAANLGIDAPVIVAEETYAWPHRGDQLVEASPPG